MRRHTNLTISFGSLDPHSLIIWKSSKLNEGGIEKKNHFAMQPHRKRYLYKLSFYYKFPNVWHQKIDFVIYHKLALVLWCHKSDSVISQNRIWKNTKSNFRWQKSNVTQNRLGEITKSILWYHKITVILSHHKIDFWYKKIGVYYITK